MYLEGHYERINYTLKSDAMNSPVPRLGEVCIDCRGRGVALNWASQAYPLLECSACGIAFADNWNEQIGSGFHEGNVSYWAERQEDAVTATEANTFNLQRARLTLQEFATLVPSKRLLDVGCGAVEFVDAASSSG